MDSKRPGCQSYMTDHQRKSHQSTDEGGSKPNERKMHIVQVNDIQQCRNVVPYVHVAATFSKIDLFLLVTMTISC